MSKPSLKSNAKILLPVLSLLLLGAALIFFDRERILFVLHRADWRSLPGALVCITLSYGLVSFSYAILAEQIGIRLKYGTLAAVFFVTAVMNRVVRSGGAAGYSVRYLILSQYGVALNPVLISSFVHFLLGSLVMLLMLPVGVAWLLATNPLPVRLALGLASLALLCLLFALGAAATLFVDRLRRRLIRPAAWLVQKAAKRDITPSLEVFNRQATEAVRQLRQAPLDFGMVLLLMFAEWWANVAVLGFCLSAFGASLPLVAVAVVYVVGIMAGVFTALPGGIGVQEAVITSLSVAQGVSFEQAVLGAMLFRVVHSFIPYLVSSLFYWRLLRPPVTETVL